VLTCCPPPAPNRGQFSAGQDPASRRTSLAGAEGKVDYSRWAGKGQDSKRRCAEGLDKCGQRTSEGQPRGWVLPAPWDTTASWHLDLSPGSCCGKGRAPISPACPKSWLSGSSIRLLTWGPSATNWGLFRNLEVGDLLPHP
jgi:hypothetical protein